MLVDAEIVQFDKQYTKAVAFAIVSLCKSGIQRRAHQ